MLSPKELLDDINSKISNREVFKRNREFLIQSLIVATLQTQSMVFSYTCDLNMTNQIIEQFRAILKFIYSVDNVNLEVPNDDDETINTFCQMLFEFVDAYTPVRNYLEQCIIGNRKIQYDEPNDLYYEESYDDYSNYARILDKAKEFPSEKLKNDSLTKMKRYIESNRYKVNVFKDMYFRSFMEDYMEICWLDSEIKFDYDFKDFKYSELISFCAALKIITDYYLVTSFQEPYFSVKENVLVNGISKLSGLSAEKIVFFLKYQTYDYEYQKDKLTLIQALIKCDDNYYFLPMTLNVGLLPIKMHRAITDYNKEKYEKDISEIAHRKETQMTEEIVEKLKKYNLSIELNYKIKGDKTPLAEYDMLAFDGETDDLYIFEFKWYFVGDGEKEHKRLDGKIKEAIEHRKEKDKFILDNPQNVCYKLFNKNKVNNVYEILVSQNFCGSVRQDMTVIDFETLQWSVDRHDSFKELMNYFFSGEYRQSIQIDSKKMQTKIEGYKFDFFRIVMKSNC